MQWHTYKRLGAWMFVFIFPMLVLCKLCEYGGRTIWAVISNSACWSRFSSALRLRFASLRKHQLHRKLARRRSIHLLAVEERMGSFQHSQRNQEPLSETIGKRVHRLHQERGQRRAPFALMQQMDYKHGAVAGALN